uniref:L1 transposable element RRM domain-containing protein n=1 Tax=Nothobranchius rachovii TaxID=451742 RepID=A0A1A8QI48_9TELE
MQGLTSRVDEVESRVGLVEDATVELTEAMVTWSKRQRNIQNKLTDLESRSRRNNIRIFGVAEGEEGTSMHQYITDFLKSKLALPAELDLRIQRAHRVFASTLRSAQPRPIIVNFQEFTTKERILKEAWKKGPIQVKDKNIYFDHDYATEVAQKRREYQGIKKALKERGIRFQTPFTSIRIHWEDGARVYGNAYEAGRELQKRGLSAETPAASTEEEEITARLQEIVSWRRAPPKRQRESSAAQRAKDRLRGYQRPGDK